MSAWPLRAQPLDTLFLFAASVTCRPFVPQAASFVLRLLNTLLENSNVGGQLKRECTGGSVLETVVCKSFRQLHEAFARITTEWQGSKL